MPNIRAGMRPEGKITILKHKAGEDPKKVTEFKNIVLDVGWDNLVETLAAETYAFAKKMFLFLGTGTTEPTRYDGGLESVSETLAGKETEEDYYGGEEGGFKPYVRLKYVYGEGEAEGVWTELGLAFDEQYSRPYNRSLVKDEEGNPISLTILSDEYLTVYVELTMIFTPLNESGTLLYNDQVINYTAITEHTSFFDSTSGYTNFWYKGPAPRMELEGSHKKILMYDYYSLGLSNVGGELVWERVNIQWPPGDVKKITNVKIGPVHGAYPTPFVEVTFDPAIEIPADHKGTWEGVRVEFFREEVPEQ